MILTNFLTIYPRTSVSERNYLKFYNAANRYGWFEEIYKINNWEKMLLGSYWSKEKCEEVSKQCKNRKELKTKYHQAYRNCMQYGWIEEFYPDCKYSKKYKEEELTMDFLKKIALQFNSKTEFRKKANGYYKKAIQSEFYEEITKHMINQNGHK